jgi:hypothetical protein
MPEPLETVFAPWSDDQVKSLNAFQRSAKVHPYTCGGDVCHEVLVATMNGWVCRSCGYTQNHATDFSANWVWKKTLHIKKNMGD